MVHAGDPHVYGRHGADDLGQGHRSYQSGVTAAVVDNVPIGLGLVAGFTSQIGDYLTKAAETVFAMPQVLNFSTGGMIYGAKLLDATQGLRIDDPVYATNLNEHFKQCVFYDILLA